MSRAMDGPLDPRALATALDAVLPERRTVVQDGGHFIEWAPMYWNVPRPQDLVMVGTAFQSIGLGLASAVGAARAVEDGRTLLLDSGDGGFLMGLADLESLIGAARSAIVVIHNDAAYGAEIHQYGSQGLTEKPMLIPEVDFSGVARRWVPSRLLSVPCLICPHCRTGSTPVLVGRSWPTAGSRPASGRLG